MSASPDASPRKSSSRLQYLDWFRGLAAVIMLQGHVFHSFASQDLRNEGPYIFSQFLGGMPPAIFLFLTGITLAFRLDGDERKGLSSWRRLVSALGRARYLIVLAFLFRLQLWLFAWPHSQWMDLFRVDILNCMALAIACLAWLGLISTKDRVQWAAVAGCAIAGAAPLISAIDWSASPWLIKNYVAPDYLFFGFFPWAAFLAFGLSMGSLLRLAGEANTERLMQWSALAGGILIVGGRYFADFQPSLYAKSEFWLDGPLLIFIKLGVVLWMMCFAYVWTRYWLQGRWSWVAQLGTTSLLVYWVHIEMVYGSLLWRWKESLVTVDTVAASVVLIAMMVGLSVAKTRYSRKGSELLRWRLTIPARSAAGAGD